MDYGYLKNTTSINSNEIAVWKGTSGDVIDAIIVTVDLLKEDSEIKVLIGCSEEEKPNDLANSYCCSRWIRF